MAFEGRCIIYPNFFEKPINYSIEEDDHLYFSVVIPKPIAQYLEEYSAFMSRTGYGIYLLTTDCPF